MALDFALRFPEKGSDTNIQQLRMEPGEALEQDLTIERILDNHKSALEAVGEWCKFLRRKTSGEPCECRDSYYQQANTDKCMSCFGTLWKGGYDIVGYDNAGIADNPLVKNDSSFLVRVIRAQTTINLLDNVGFQPSQIPTGWCLAPPFGPEVTTRDVLISGYQFDRTAVETVEDQPVVRGVDKLPTKDTVYNIVFIKPQLQSQDFFNRSLYSLSQDGTITWLDPTQAPANGSTYYVTYEKIVTYAQLYQVSKVKTNTVRGIPTIQLLDLTELPAGHPINDFLDGILPKAHIEGGLNFGIK